MKKTVLLNTMLLFEKPWVKVLFCFPLYGCGLASSALYSHRSVSLYGIILSLQVAISLRKTVIIFLFQHWRPQWAFDIWVYINGHPWHWGAFLLQFSQTSSRSSSHVPRSFFASIQPGLAWRSVGSHLTSQPPTEDVFDSSGFLIKWTLSKNFVFSH